MYTYPWTNLTKKLEQRSEQAKQELSTSIRIDDMHQWFEDIKNIRLPWYESLWYDIERKFHDTVWWIYRLFRPCHQDVRRAIPRRWTDSCQLILDVNFAIIKEFVEHEMDNVAWDDSDRPAVQEAGKWLRESYTYITFHRHTLQGKHLEALRNAGEIPVNKRRTMTYDQIYGEANAIEQEIDDRDRRVLEGMAKHRLWMWT